MALYMLRIRAPTDDPAIAKKTMSTYTASPMKTYSNNRMQDAMPTNMIEVSMVK